MDEEANEQTTDERVGVVLLLNGMQIGPVPVTFTPLGLAVPSSVTMRPSKAGGKAREVETSRMIPWTSIAFIDLLPEDFTDD